MAKDDLCPKYDSSELGKPATEYRESINKESRFAKYRGAGLGDIKTKAQMDAWLKDLRGRDE